MRSHTPSPSRRARAVAAVAVGLAVASFGSAQAATSTSASGAAGSGLRWGPCPTGAPAPQECATLRVPLDYRQPHGRTIALEVSRIPAADPAKRWGVLMT